MAPRFRHMQDEPNRRLVLEFLLGYIRALCDVGMTSPSCHTAGIAVSLLTADEVPATVSKVADMTGLSRDRARHALKFMVKKGWLEAYRGKHGMVYVRGPKSYDVYEATRPHIERFVEIAQKMVDLRETHNSNLEKLQT